MDITFIFIIFCFLFLPGATLVKILNIQNNKILHSITLSYCSYFTLFGITSYFQVLERTLFIGMLSLTIISACLLFFVASWKRNYSIKITPEWYSVLGIVITVFFYSTVFGASNDLPADLYTHMERMQIALADLTNKTAHSKAQSVDIFNQGYAWYYLIAVIADFTATESNSIVESVSFVTNSILLVGLFSFAKSIFNKRKNASFIATLTCLFFFFHMGINIFSFARYYALAPTMIGFCIYFSAIALFLQSIQEAPYKELPKNLSIIIVYTLTCINNHTQEAIFIATICFLITLIYVCRCWLCLPQPSNTYRNRQSHKYIWSCGLVILLLNFTLIYLYAHLNLTRSPNAHWRLWEFSQGWGVIPDITTLNLKNQFIQVLTLWGALIYCLFFIHWKHYKNNLFIIAGMTSPLFTILNPFFVDLFLRLDNSTTLWRLSYILPIHFVAADLTFIYFKKIKSSIKIKKLTLLLILSLFTILLLPFKNTWQGIHYSRFPTLGKTPHQTSYQYYSDVLNFLSTQNKNTVITDVITGYLVASMTHHESPRRKFFRNYQYNHFSFHEYHENTFDKYQGYLLVINQRPQPISELGRISGHWRANELQSISNYYPEALMTHIKENQSKFEKLWSDNGITVYKIR